MIADIPPEAARALINLGRAQEALDAALHHLHVAQTVTPLGGDETRRLGVVAEQVAVRLRAHRAAVGCDGDGEGQS